ncbi:hypothetical protein HANVADRAFT_48479 [Hanseniaspora valbyensis NRRL Y-1626]|uniref:Uncharacterized protein n=1 Tax=Hanseniaspora valbyensis NRRL Y-1626 TaxID=766949 RepID=A0A1B7TEQ7_9ASCO|nr:hypothetical protein HANVADRAFT_48479 [Hanseniaspora valbyensis NRRL Y-1626]
MGLFGNNNTSRSIPDLSRYDYHYGGSHVNGYNIESGSNATARQYVRSIPLTAGQQQHNNKNYIKTYPQTRRTIKKSKKGSKTVPNHKQKQIYHDDDEEEEEEDDDQYYQYQDNIEDHGFNNHYEEEDDDDGYDVVDFDDKNNQYTQKIDHNDYDGYQDDDGEENSFDHSPDRYNSITSVTTTTTTTTKEIDSASGLETVTKTVKKTLPDGTVKTTIVKLQKPTGTSRNSSRTNSLIGSPHKGDSKREYLQPMFNRFSSDQYTDGIVEEEDEGVEDQQQQKQYHLQAKRHRSQRTKKALPVYAQQPKPVQQPRFAQSNFLPGYDNNNNTTNGTDASARLTSAEMYARALEIAREKVMSDPSRIVAVEAANQKLQNKKSKFKKIRKNQDPEIIPPNAQIGTKKYEIPRSLRDGPNSAATTTVDVKASETDRVSEPVANGATSINTLTNVSKATQKKSKFNPFKIFKKKDKAVRNEKISLPVNTEVEQLQEEQPELQNTVVVTGGDNVATKTVVVVDDDDDEGSDSDIEFLPVAPEEEDAEEYPQMANDTELSDENEKTVDEVTEPLTPHATEKSFYQRNHDIKDVETQKPKVATLPVLEEHVPTIPKVQNQQLKNPTFPVLEESVTSFRVASAAGISSKPTTFGKKTETCIDKTLKEDCVPSRVYEDEIVENPEEEVEEEIVNDNGEDVTELYNDVPDPLSSDSLEHLSEHPEGWILQDVPLLRTMQSESELRDALENLDEDREVDVLKGIGNDKAVGYEKEITENITNNGKEAVKKYDNNNVTTSLNPNEQAKLNNNFTETTQIDSRQVVKEPATISNKNLQVNETKQTAPAVPTTIVTEEKTKISGKQPLPSIRNPIITLNEPVKITKEEIKVEKPIISQKHNIPTEADHVERETENVQPKEQVQSNHFYNNFTSQQKNPQYHQQVNNSNFQPETNNEQQISKQTTIDSSATKKPKKSGGLMSKLVQFSNDNYGNQIDKEQKDIKEKKNKTIKAKEEKVAKKTSKWKLFKKEPKV